MKRTLIALALVVAGISASAVLPSTAWSAETAVAAATATEAAEVSNEQMVAWYENGRLGRDIWLFDSRPAGKFITGHIPGAINLPLDVLKKDPAAVIDKYAIPKTSTVVFYCAGRECTLSVDSADIFRKAGYADAVVYRNGVPGWNQKMQPLLATEAFIRKGNVILIDTLPGQATIVANGVQTLQLSLKELGADKGKALLADLSRNAPLVVVGRGDAQAVNAALEELRDQDFRRLATFPLNAWTAPPTAAPALTRASWAPVYGPGQISPKDFERAVAAGEFILDIRPAADFARGHFRNAVNIPIEDFEKSAERIPRDRAVFLHCTSGAKSQKAFDILGRKGYTNLKYLDAEVACKGEVCTIKE